MEGATIPPIAAETPDLFLDRLLHPARHFERPQDVLTDMTLDVREKRAILSSWASDACAVESVPALRMPPGATAPLNFDAVMEALRDLDELSRQIGSDREADGSTVTGFAATVNQL